MKPGVRLESLGLPFRPALAAAMRTGVTGVQFDATGDMHPDRLTATGRREVLHLLRSHGLELTALHCPLRHSLDQPLNLDPRLAHLQKALTLSVDLGARKVIVDAGTVPEKEDDPRAATLREALTVLGANADRIGARLAIDVGRDPGERLAAYLDTFPLGGLAVNFDPANFLVHGFDPVAQIIPLKKYLAHVQAHDAQRGSAGRLARSVVLGGGDVDWMAALGTLSVAEYRGWIVVKLDEPNAEAVAAGVKFLRRLL